MSATTRNQTSIEISDAVPTVTITREFDAPVALVFRAYTEPDLFQQWIGPRNRTFELEEFDCRTGGAWRYSTRDENFEAKFYGAFHEVRTDERIVQTFTFEGFPDQRRPRDRRLRGPRGRPLARHLGLARRLLRGARRVRGQRHGDRCGRGLREARRAARDARLSGRSRRSATLDHPCGHDRGMSDHTTHTVHVPGLVLTEHEVTVPLDHAAPPAPTARRSPSSPVRSPTSMAATCRSWSSSRAARAARRRGRRATRPAPPGSTGRSRTTGC